MVTGTLGRWIVEAALIVALREAQDPARNPSEVVRSGPRAIDSQWSAHDVVDGKRVAALELPLHLDHQSAAQQVPDVEVERVCRAREVLRK